MSNIRENKEDLQKVVQTVGNLLSKNIPFDWDAIVYGYFLFGEDQAHCQHIWALNPETEDYVDLMKELWEDDDFLDATEEIADCVSEFHEKCAEALDDWSEMTFVIRESGKFSLDFKYDKLDSFTYAYLMDWQSRFFE